MSKWTPERLRALLDELEALRAARYSKLADRSTEAAKVELGQLGATIAIVRSAREDAQRDSTMAMLENQTRQRTGGTRRS